MDNTELSKLIDAASRVLGPHLERSEPLRTLVGMLGQWLSDQAKAAENPHSSAPDHTSSIPRPSATPGVGPAAPVIVGPRVVVGTPTKSALVPLKIGDTLVHVEASGTTRELGRARQSAASFTDDEYADRDAVERTPPDLQLIAKRSRLKAASCRLFIERRAAAPGSDVESEALVRLNEMVGIGKSLPDCYLWVFNRDKPQPGDDRLHVIAECYEALADAAEAMLHVDEAAPEQQTEGLPLLAEACSGLRASLHWTWLTRDDQDQMEAHIWARQAASSRRVYISRHMTADDIADPAGAPDLRVRIAALRRTVDEQQGRSKAIKQALSRIRYHAGRIAKEPDDEHAGDWAKIADGVESLMESGVPPTDRRVVEALGETAAALAPVEKLEGGLAATIAAALKSNPINAEDADHDEPDDRPWSAEVLDVRSRVRGRTFVLIGGEPRPEAAARLKAAFELDDVTWVELNEHGTGSPMRAPIHRPETALVLVIIKLAGHLQVDEAKAYARDAGKPCIMLKAGYGPERVAADILEQASERLPQPTEA